MQLYKYLQFFKNKFARGSKRMRSTVCECNCLLKDFLFARNIDFTIVHATPSADAHGNQKFLIFHFLTDNVFIHTFSIYKL